MRNRNYSDRLQKVKQFIKIAKRIKNRNAKKVKKTVKGVKVIKWLAKQSKNLHKLDKIIVQARRSKHQKKSFSKLSVISRNETRATIHSTKMLI